MEILFTIAAVIFLASLAIKLIKAFIRSIFH